MQLTAEEQSLLMEVIDKHIAFVDANRRNVAAGSINNMKKRQQFAEKLANLQNLRSKIGVMSDA